MQDLRFALEVLHVDVSGRMHTAVGRIKNVTLATQTAIGRNEFHLGQLELESAATQAVTTNIQAGLQQTSAGVSDLLDAEMIRRVGAVVTWLSAPDPYINHNDARKRHEPGTGKWLLQCSQYRRWVAETGSRLWLHGKAGCCKTVICSTVIEDVKCHVSGLPGCVLAFFYFSFSDQRKQTYHGVLLSLVTQLSRGRPLVPVLDDAYEIKGQPSCGILEEVIWELVVARERTFIILDALDEIPYGPDRQEVLDGLGRLIEHNSSLTILLTSRPEHDISDSMRGFEVESLAASQSGVNNDIKLYVEKGLERHPRLKHLSSDLKNEIMDTLSSKADGM